MNNIEQSALDKICELKGVSIDKTLSKSRKDGIAEVRQLYMYWLKLNTRHTLSKIGKLCGGRHYTTVIHGIANIKDILDTDYTTKQIWTELNDYINEVKC